MSSRYYNLYISVSSTNKLGFTPEFVGRVKLVTSVASLLGVGLYNGFLKTVRLRKIFLVTTLIGSTLGMTQVWFMPFDPRPIRLFAPSNMYLAFKVPSFRFCSSLE